MLFRSRVQTEFTDKIATPSFLTAFAERPTFDQFLLLSLLLHVLAVLLFGDTSGVANKLGQRLWGASAFNFNATLQPGSRDAANAAKKSENKNKDETKSKANGDTKSDIEGQAATKSITPSSANVDANVAAPASQKAEAATVPSQALPAPAETVSPTSASTPTPTPTPEQSGATPTPELQRFIAKEVLLPTTPFVVSTPTLKPDVAAPTEQMPAVATTIPVPPALETPIEVPPPVLREPKQSIAPAVSLDAPSVAAFPTTVPTPKVERILVAPPLPKLDIAPVDAPITQPALPTVSTPVLRKVEAKVELKPEDIRHVKIEPAEVKLPEIKTPEIKIPEIRVPEVKVPTVKPAEIRAPEISIPSPAVEVVPRFVSPTPIPAPAAPITASPAAAAQSGALTKPPPANAAVDADPLGASAKPLPPKGDRDGANATAPGVSRTPAVGDIDKPASKIDLDGLRNRVRAITSEGNGPRMLLPFPVAPPVATKKKVEEIFDKALKRPDCRDAYADMGLAAVVPLVRDALTEKGCKW